HPREWIDQRHFRFLSALTNKPGAPTSGHGCICKATALALDNVAICVFVVHDEQLRVNCVDECLREVRNLLRARAATILQLVVGKKCQALLDQYKMYFGQCVRPRRSRKIYKSGMTESLSSGRIRLKNRAKA